MDKQQLLEQTDKAKAKISLATAMGQSHVYLEIPFASQLLRADRSLLYADAIISEMTPELDTSDPALVITKIRAELQRRAAEALKEAGNGKV